MAAKTVYYLPTDDEIDQALLIPFPIERADETIEYLDNKYTDTPYCKFPLDLSWLMHCVICPYPMQAHFYPQQRHPWQAWEKYGKYPLNMVYYGGHPLCNIYFFHACTPPEIKEEYLKLGAHHILSEAQIFYLRPHELQDVVAALETLDDATIAQRFREWVEPTEMFQRAWLPFFIQAGITVEYLLYWHNDMKSFFKFGASEGRGLITNHLD